MFGCNSDSAVNDTKLSADVVQKLKQDFVFELKKFKVFISTEQVHH
jgi:hypothetical protein